MIISSYPMKPSEIMHLVNLLVIIGLLFTQLAMGHRNTSADEVKDLDIEQTERMSTEKAIIKDLLGRYSRVGKMGRPVFNTSDSVVIHFGLGLIQMDLDEKNKVLTMSMWTRYAWRDEYLQWNPADYGGVSSVRLEHDHIWKPDIMLYNTAEVDKTSRDALVVVGADGSVNWYPHTIFQSSCAVDVSNFPFDSQQCHMWFGSWTHPSNEIDLQMAHPDGIDLSTFQSDHKESCGWDIINVTAKRQAMPSEDEDPHFIVLTFDLDMKRKFVFSSYILTLPCVFLACLTLVVFWLPPERPDRTALAMSTFGTFMVLLLILVEAAPPTASSIPTLGLYYAFNMVIIMMAIVLSSLVVNTSRGGSRKVPKWLSALTNSFLIRVLCLKPIPSRMDRSLAWPSCSYIPCPKSADSGIRRQAPNDNYSCASGLLVGYLNATPPREEKQDLASGDSPQLAKAINTVGEVHKTLQHIEELLEDGGARRLGGESFRNYREWRHVSLVLDRFFFLVYVLLIIISLSVLFPWPR